MPSRRSTPRLEGEREQGADLEDPDEYRAENILWVSPEARWTHLKAQARQATIGQLVPSSTSSFPCRSRKPRWWRFVLLV